MERSTRRIAIIGGGISGLTLAWRLSQIQPETEIILLERETSVGGLARGSVERGFTLDGGPSAFVAKPNTGVLRLAQALGVERELIPASSHAKRRYLAWGEGLEAVPSTPLAWARSPLLTKRGKIRLLLEPCVPWSRREATVHAFARSRLGQEFADVFMAAMLRGITGGDAHKTSAHALFPRMIEVGQQRGSLFLGLFESQLKRALLKREHGEKVSQRAVGMMSFSKEGMGRLPEILRERLNGQIHMGCEVDAIESGERKRWRLRLLERGVIEADAVVVATPAPVSAQLLAELSPSASRELLAIPHADIRVLALAFRREDVPHALDGFGFLCGPQVQEQALGCLWSSSLFPVQAPEGHVLFRIMCGGAQDVDTLARSDAEIEASSREMLSRRMGIHALPVATWHMRHAAALPQYLIGHRERIERIQLALPPSIVLVGNAYKGPGVNDCIDYAWDTAARIPQWVFDR